MKYIGNKTRVLHFIEECLKKSKVEYKNVKVADLFAGTGSVSNFFLRNGCSVYSCDNMTYSICEQYRINFFTSEPSFYELKKYGLVSLSDVINYLNGLTGKKGYYFDNYAPSGKYGRKYFSDENAMKIDSISDTLAIWKKVLPQEKYCYLMGIFMCAADKVSNTAGTYGAYLKIWRSMALKELRLVKPDISSAGKNIIIQSDVCDFSKKFKSFDIVYLDPPYNSRQYAGYFHVLENIVSNDKPDLLGKTGMRRYDNQKSDYCIKSKVVKSFENLVKYIDSKCIVMSYSTEGLLSEDEIVKILSQKGRVSVYKHKYRRFKTNSWTSNKTGLKEIVFICIVDDDRLKTN